MSATSLLLTRAPKQGGRLRRNRLSSYAHSVLGWLYYFPGGTFATIQLRVPWRVRPNPSVKPSPNGGPPGPGHRYGVHFLWPGPGVPPSVPAYLER